MRLIECILALTGLISHTKCCMFVCRRHHKLVNEVLMGRRMKVMQLKAYLFPYSLK